MSAPTEPPGQAPAPVEPLALVEAPSPPFDPNRNLVYDVLLDVADLEMVGRIKWDIFSVEERLERALREDVELARSAPEVKQELELALEVFRADPDVIAYKERFVRSEERLKLLELVRFLELAVHVREPLHAAWTRYLAYDHDRLLREIIAVDVEGLARRPSTLLTGARETESRRCKAVVVHTERSARQVFNEIPFRDYARVIAWYEEKNPLLANLIAESRVLYLHTSLLRQTTEVSKKLEKFAVVVGLFAAATTIAAIIAFFV